MSRTAAPSMPVSFAGRLGSVRVGLREDLEVSRHVFRGEATYIIQDPVTFQHHRLDREDYQVLVGISPEYTLGEVFKRLVERNLASQENEEQFYMFVMGLHRIGFLRLPLSDEKLLYQRHVAKARATRRAKLMGFLFWRIPVVNPSAFLDRTTRYFSPLFTRPAFAAWTVLVFCAAFVLIRNWDRFVEPLVGVLATRNLVLMWVTLIALKVFHEFGHAYACRHYGGHVPEMGIFLILFTPCAYVDATASWGFVRKRERLIVCLGGMYFESMIAATAVFVWAMTGPSLLNSVAYNVVILAGVVTVLFNINPLMRYDGYYILSDLIEVPNLRARSMQYVLNLLRKVVLRLPVTRETGGRRLCVILFAYGVAATIYRMTLLLAISAILAVKMFVVGMAMAVVYLGGTVVKAAYRLIHFLWFSEETAPIRGRAVAFGVLVLIVGPTGIALLPLPSSVKAAGVVTTEKEVIVRAREAGFLQAIQVSFGQSIESGDSLAILVNDAIEEPLAFAEADLRASYIRKEAFRVAEPGRVLQEEERAKAFRSAVQRGRERLADLEIRSPLTGRVIHRLHENAIGSFIHVGDAVATIAAGRWQVRALLTEESLDSVDPQKGDTVQFRSSANPALTLEGVIFRVAPAGSRTIEHAPLTHLGGGDIAVDPTTSEAREPYFEVIVDLHVDSMPGLGYGMTGTLCFGGTSESVGRIMYRRLSRFIRKIMQD